MFRLKITGIVIGSIAFTILVSPRAYAQLGNQPDELQAIYACKLIANAQERLGCYDNTVRRFQAAEKNGKLVTVSKTAIEKVERDAFGFNIPSLPSLGGIFGGNNKESDTSKRVQKENDLTAPVKQAGNVQSSPKPTQSPRINKAIVPSKVSEVTLDIRKTSEFGYQKTRFFMMNGQVWEQVGTTRVRIPKIKNGKAYTAEISKAALGSFMLQINGKGAAIRVRRVR